MFTEYRKIHIVVIAKLGINIYIYIQTAMLGTREYTLCSPFRANAHNSSSIWSRSIIVIMDLFLILTQFSYTICIQEKERSLHVTTQFNITINMAAFGHISDAEVTFLEISAEIIIQVQNILCGLVITFFS